MIGIFWLFKRGRGWKATFFYLTLKVWGSWMLLECEELSFEHISSFYLLCKQSANFKGREGSSFLNGPCYQGSKSKSYCRWRWTKSLQSPQRGQWHHLGVTIRTPASISSNFGTNLLRKEFNNCFPHSNWAFVTVS